MLCTHRFERCRGPLPALATLLVFFLPLTGIATTLRLPDDPVEVIQILTVINGQKVAESATTPDVTITRASRDCADTSIVARKGLRLCKGDRIKTAINWTVRITFDEKNEFTLLPESEVTIGSFNCGGLCRWFASLNNRFTNRVPHAALTNRSTVYEVHTEKDKTSTLMVYEGEVEVRTDAHTTVNSSPDSSTAGSSAGPATASVAIEMVPPLYKGFILSNGTFEKVPMDEADLREALAASSEAEITIHRRPAEAGGVLKFLNFDDSRRNDKFRVARAYSFLRPNDPQNFEILGKIYNDWGSGAEAVKFFAKADELNRQSNAAWLPRDEQRIDRAFALYQAGETKEALKAVEAVLAQSHPDLLSYALDVRGSIFYDQAKQALRDDQTEAGNTLARELLQKAKADFVLAGANLEDSQRQSADGSPSQATQGNLQQYINVNLGHVIKAQGDIAQHEKRYQDATLTYIHAGLVLEKAFGTTHDRENRVAGVLVALADTFDLRGKKELAKSYYSRAKVIYVNSILDAEAEGHLTEAYCGLASLNQIMGEADEAQRNYERCVAYNVDALITEVDVPKVVGLTRIAAIHALAEVGLVPDLDGEGQLVGSQTPEAKVKAKVGDKIKVTLIVPPTP